MFVVLYVDDLLYAGDDAELIAQFKRRLSRRFKVRHMDGSNYLGLDIASLLSILWSMRGGPTEHFLNLATRPK